MLKLLNEIQEYYLQENVDDTSVAKDTYKQEENKSQCKYMQDHWMLKTKII